MQLRSKSVQAALACLLVVAASAAASGCDSKDKDDDKKSNSATPAAPPPPPPATTPPAAPPTAAPPPVAPPPAAPASDVTRYPNEVPLANRPAVIADGIGARKQAKAEAPVFQTLAKGTAVTQIAQSGNWTLVGWKNNGVDAMGWVESAPAFGAKLDPTRQRAADVARKGGLLFPK